MPQDLHLINAIYFYCTTFASLPHRASAEMFTPLAQLSDSNCSKFRFFFFFLSATVFRPPTSQPCLFLAASLVGQTGDVIPSQRHIFMNRAAYVLFIS